MPDRIIIIVCLQLNLAWSLQAADEPAPQTYSIMPVGDSITAGGNTFCNYRYPLLQKLTAAGYRVQYVGSRSSQSPAGPLAHEGYGGKNAEFLASVLVTKFRDHPADIVLIHAGHNHFVEEQPVPGIVAATETMIREVRTVNPRVMVLLAQVIPSGKLPKYAYIPELNARLSQLAKRPNAPTQPVILVDQATGFDWTMDTIADKVHPNAKGAEKMADRWFATLNQLLEEEDLSP